MELNTKNENSNLQMRKLNVDNDLKNILDVIDFGIMVIDESQILYVNQYFLSLLHVSPESTLNQNLIEFLHAMEIDPNQFNVHMLKERIKKFQEPKNKERKITLKNGREIWLEISVKDIFFQNKKCILVTLRDITQIKYAQQAIKKKQEQLDREFLRNQKIESIGVLAGGIAHDYNNILTSIMGNLELLNFYSPEEKEYQEIITDLHEGVVRAKQLTKQFLVFSKGGNPIKKPESIEELVKESANFILRGAKSKCIYYFEENLPMIDVDAGQINQVLNNILLNADQAMENSEQAIIKISAVPTVITAKTEEVPLEPGQYILLSIQDRGRGIPKSIQSRIFQPYFTTKRKGNGLGLATAYSIIRHHGGYIRFVSEEFIGTTFYIYLPVSKTTKNAYEIVQEEKKEKKLAFKGKIIVLDDEEAILMLIQRMCDQLGIECETASDGTELLVKYISAKALNNPYDLVILDLTIPGGMGGEETIRQLKSQHPDSKVIVSSGYSNDSVLADYKNYGFDDILRKPYSFDEFRRIVSKYLPKSE